LFPQRRHPARKTSVFSNCRAEPWRNIAAMRMRLPATAFTQSKQSWTVGVVLQSPYFGRSLPQAQGIER
jgi:hypothetical protein